MVTLYTSGGNFRGSGRALRGGSQAPPRSLERVRHIPCGGREPGLEPGIGDFCRPTSSGIRSALASLALTVHQRQQGNPEAAQPSLPDIGWVEVPAGDLVVMGSGKGDATTRPKWSRCWLLTHEGPNAPTMRASLPLSGATLPDGLTRPFIGVRKVKSILYTTPCHLVESTATVLPTIRLVTRAA